MLHLVMKYYNFLGHFDYDEKKEQCQCHLEAVDLFLTLPCVLQTHTHFLQVQIKGTTAVSAVTAVKLYFTADGSGPTSDVLVSVHNAANLVKLYNAMGGTSYIMNHPDAVANPEGDIYLGTTQGIEDPETIAVDPDIGYRVGSKVLVQGGNPGLKIAELEIFFTAFGEFVA